MSLAPWRRHLALACFCAGLALAPLRQLPAGSSVVLLAAIALFAIAVLRLRIASAASAAAPAAATANEGPISLGSATEADLETIDGIGPVTAADIIEFRDSSGGVGSIDQLDEIPGIGPATIEALGARLQP